MTVFKPYVLNFSDFSYEYIQKSGLRDPVLFEKPEGLGMK